MCTVTFIPVEDGFFITSNRDEKVLRKQAIPPQVYEVNGVQLLFPKDADAGGTWIVVKDHSNAAVLLNGGFTNHVPLPMYKKSRGILLLEIFTANTPVNYFMEENLQNIEPFTLILLQDKILYECRWSGDKKYCRQPEIKQSHIWSSTTLYNATIRKKREKWFCHWLQQNINLTTENIVDFHLYAGDGNKYNDIRMNREGELFTVSITSIYATSTHSVMTYLDLKDGKKYIVENGCANNNYYRFSAHANKKHIL